MKLLKKLFGKSNNKSETGHQPASSKLKTVELEITGMTCDHCATTIENQFTKQGGIKKKEVSYPGGTGRFVFNADKISKQDIVNTINATGQYKVIEEGNQSVSEASPGGKAPQGSSNYQYDLIIIGGGSAAFSAASTAGEQGKKTLLINEGLPIGGTCVNVGCIPSKNLIRAAESIHHASSSPFPGIKPNVPEVDFGAIIRQKKKLVKNMQRKKYLDVADGIEGLTIIKGWATFKDENTIEVDGKEYTGEKFLIATGATTRIPPIDGLAEVGYLTNDSLFDLEEKPKSLTIVGGGYIGLEIAMAYNRFGVKVRIIESAERVLPTQTLDISAELEKHLKNEGIEIYPDYSIEKVEKRDIHILIKGKNGKNGEAFEFTEPDHIVVATGIKPNTGKLGLENIGLGTGEKGFIEVNEQMQTAHSHIYSAGDCTNTPAFVYTAAREAKIAVRNALTGENSKVDYAGLPWVVFTDPQIAGAGMDEQEAETKGISFETSVLPLSEVPRSAAALDTRGFIKLIRNPETDKLLGARIVAPEGGELAMQVSFVIKHGITVKELSESFHPYLTLSEGIKLAAITFEKDVGQLSCCAS